MSVSSLRPSMVLSVSSMNESSTPPALKRNTERLHDLEKRFNERLIGQEEAVHDVCRMLKCVVTGFYDDKVPYGVLLFAGPTGVGKTQLAKMIAEELAVPLVRYDMSEFSEEHTRSSLLGAPPGYVGCTEEGRLIRDLKKNPVAVVLFDEIEKAHPDIFPTFLQLFDEGHLTDRMGNFVDAKTTIFIMTTNLGSAFIQQQIASSSKAPLIKILEPLFIRRFTPEFYNRIHSTIVFQPISRETLCTIARLFMKSLAEDIFQNKKIILKWTSGTIQFFAEADNNLAMGARGIHRRIRQTVLPLLADTCIKKKIAEGDAVRVKTCQNGAVLKVGVIFRKRLLSKCPETRVVQVCTTGQPLENLIGKYVLRIGPMNGDRSYMEDPIKIIASNEHTSLAKKAFLGRFHLKPVWNDNQWILPSPDKDAQHFLLNCTLEIPEKQKRKSTRQLIKSLYNPIDGLYGTPLVSNDPWTELTQSALKRNSRKLIELIEQLKKNLGPLAIERPQPRIYSSAHYDFDLPTKKSNKRHACELTDR